MTTSRTTLRPVSRDRPCEVCHGSHKCSRGADGLLVCGRVPDHRRPGDAAEGLVYLGPADGDPQFGMFRREGDPVLAAKEEEWRRDRTSRLSSPRGDGHTANGAAHHAENGQALAPVLAARALDLAGRLTPALRSELAGALGLPEHCLAEIPLLGFDEGEGCWTLPEHDGAGRVVGISRRYRSGEKKAVAGGSRGLTVPERWSRGEGVLFLPEGASDTLSLTALGLSAVGRPSNTGGVAQLIDLLRDLPKDREIWVLAELDPKPNGDWPGRDGAQRTAARLAKALARPVRWALPPDAAKDVRAWAEAQGLDPACADSWAEAGDRFASGLRPVTPRAEETPAGFVWAPIDSGEFARAEYSRRWLVKRVLVEGQPALAGGAKKMLKTSTFVDLAVSLASGTKFLGAFEVPRPVRVCMLSGETGEHGLQQVARRVADARGLRLEDLGDNLLWMFRLPQLAKPDHLQALREGLRASAVDVLIFDPLYLSLLSGQGPNGARAENLFDMGPLLLGIAEACLGVGTTPLLVHHARKGSAASFEPLDLDDLSYAGLAEFARQWLLLSRREKFTPGTGQHKLWLSAGGSAGHGGLWAVDVDEGILDDDFGGRKWDVTVATASEERRAAEGEREAARREDRVRREREDDMAFLAALDGLDSSRRGAALAHVRTRSALSKDRADRAYGRLKSERIIEDLALSVTVGNGAQRQAQGIRRRSDDG